MRVSLVALAALCAVVFAADEIKISDVDRTIDISTQVVKVSYILTAQNAGSSDVKSLTVLLSEEEAKHLSYIAAGESAAKELKYKVAKTTGAKAGFQAFSVDLQKPIAKGASLKLKVDYRLTGMLTPLPTKIDQSESQFIVYEGSAHVASIYPIATQKTAIKLASGKLLSNTAVEPSKQVGEKINYGPYTNAAAYSQVPIRVHSENNAPFVVATLVERLIEVSHWGNVAVEEYIELVHKGAELKGTFSRLDYQLDRRSDSKIPALKSYTTVLPAAARDIYYRDEIGNISTSAVRVRASSIDVVITPRFPLFGGWKTSYVLGYNVPASEMLYSKGNEFALRARLLDHIFDGVFVEKLVTKIVLPEHVSKVKVATPFTVQRRPDEIRATYLDTTGRTVVVLEKENLVDSHMQTFTVSYEFTMSSMLREPLLASAFIFGLFLIVIIYVRLDFTIVEDAGKDARDRAQGKVDKLAALVGKRNKYFDQITSAVRQFKESRDLGELAAARKKVEGERAETTEKMNALIAEIKNDSAEMAEKASELNRLEKAGVEAESVYVSAAQKSTTKSGPEDKTFATKIAELRAKTDVILGSF